MRGILDNIIPIVRGDAGYADVVISDLGFVRARRSYRLNPYTLVYIDMTQDWPKYEAMGLIPYSQGFGYVEDFIIFRGWHVEYDLKADGTMAYLSIDSSSRPQALGWLTLAAAGALAAWLLLRRGRRNR